MPADRATFSAIKAWVNSSGTTAFKRNSVETPDMALRSESTSRKSPCTTDTPAGKLAFDSLVHLYAINAGSNQVALTRLSTLAVPGEAHEYNVSGFGVSGGAGTALGEFNAPIHLCLSERGLCVADAGNNRVQIFDLEGNFIQQLHQFSRPSGIWLTKDDVLYVTDSESESVSRNHDGWKRGIRWGSLKDGKIIGFIPDPVETTKGTSAAEGVAADAMGNIYGAEVGPKRMMKYVRK